MRTELAISNLSGILDREFAFSSMARSRTNQLECRAEIGLLLSKLSHHDIMRLGLAGAGTKLIGQIRCHRAGCQRLLPSSVEATEKGGGEELEAALSSS